MKTSSGKMKTEISAGAEQQDGICPKVVRQLALLHFQ